jgi:hypothetical protein
MSFCADSWEYSISWWIHSQSFLNDSVEVVDFLNILKCDILFWLDDLVDFFSELTLDSLVFSQLIDDEC